MDVGQLGNEMALSLNLGLIANIASILGLVLCFVAAAGWWRVARLIAQDREANIDALDLYETYRHLERADQLLKKFLLAGGTSPRDKTKIIDVRDGLVGSRKSLNLAFFMVHDIKITNSDSLVRIAKRHQKSKRLKLAALCYELALSNSRDGKELSDEDHRTCIGGLQLCAIALGDREEAGRWAREAKTRQVPGCKDEQELARWFALRRFFVVMALAKPDFLSRPFRRQGPP